MTSFNAASILMPLDDYYEHCVLPKPQIPKHYPGVMNNNKRLAGHLKSYKDNTGEIEDDVNDDEVMDEFNSSIQDSNMNQLDYETNEFNQVYDNIEDPTKDPVTDMVSEPKNLRIQANNDNKPQGAAHLVPNNVQRAQANSMHAGRENQKRRRNRNRYTGNNNNNNSHNNVHSRLGFNNHGRAQVSMEQRMRNTFNVFNNQQAEQSNRPQQHQQQHQQHQVLMNINNHFQNGRQMNLRNQDSIDANLNFHNNPSNNQFNYCGNQSNGHMQNFQVSSSITSMISSANKIHNNMQSPAVPHRLGAPMQNQQNGITIRDSGNFLRPNFNQNNNLQRNNNNLVAGDDSLRLADLMNMDKDSCRNLNVSEVAKNAMLLLSSVFNKPILNEDLQNGLSDLQPKDNLFNETGGIDMNIQPKISDDQMYHRFK